MSITEQENNFFIVFEELIKTFSDDKNLSDEDEETGFSKDFISELESALSSLGSQSSSFDRIAAGSEQESSPENPRLERKFREFMNTLEETSFRYGMIPYDRITEVVFINTPVEILNKFTADLHKRGHAHLEEGRITEGVEELEYEKLFYKILRHIDLALVQKNTFTRLQLAEIDILKVKHQGLIENYNKLKEDAENQYKSMLTQFITILGIFAAILMGAFGSIHVFTNLFNNAHRLNLGVILILSSVGASAVILILFFLLNGIAKLTERSLWSTNKPNGTLLEKHPSLVIIHGILLFISLIGASLELSDVHLQYAAQGYWWIAPIIWITYFFTALHKKNFLFFIDWIKSFFSYIARIVLASLRGIKKLCVRVREKIIRKIKKGDRSQ